MHKNIDKLIYWAPRLISILFLCFLAMFSLDVFDGNYGFWGTIVGLFMHNIPVFILLIVLLISWKHEIVAGIVFILAGFLYIAIMARNMLTNPFEGYMLSYSLIIAGPAFIVGILFLVNWFKRKHKAISMKNNY
jgi:hypothetical protein